MTVRFIETREFPLNVPVVVVGAGACGLSAALAAHDAGAEVLVIERDSAPAGSTALSSGFIPASFTRLQRAAGIVDSPESMAVDIQHKNAAGADPGIVAAVCRASGPTLEWLADAHGVHFVLVEGFLYPGHSAMRMHAVPEKTGAALMTRLLSACGKAGIDILADAHVTALYADASKRVRGMAIERPDGSVEEVGCTALVLACSGFGGNAQMVARHIPELAGVAYFGHAGNQGDAARWGEQLGAALADMSAYQGHGSVATPHGVLITWALMMAGGIQVNTRGERFSNEHEGYSEQCVQVLAQPGHVAWSLYDERLHRLGMEFPDYREAEALGAVKRGNTLNDLAAATGLPGDALQRTLDQTVRIVAGKESDPHGRDFTGKPVLCAPFYAAKVTGALFHTQGGLEIDTDARVLGRDRRPLPNLFAGGGAARGLSGAHVWGYLSGNGLLSAVVLGRLAGESASQLADFAQRFHLHGDRLN